MALYNPCLEAMYLNNLEPTVLLDLKIMCHVETKSTANSLLQHEILLQSVTLIELARIHKKNGPSDSDSDSDISKAAGSLRALYQRSRPQNGKI